MANDWTKDYERYQALAKQRGITPRQYLPGDKIDWSSIDPFRDMPVKDRPKTAKIGGGARRTG